MYTPDQVETMIFQHCAEKLNMVPPEFNNYKASRHSLNSFIGMDSIDVVEFIIFIEEEFGVTMSVDEMCHLSLQSIIQKCVSLQKPKPAPEPQAKQAKPKPAPKPKVGQAKPKPAPKPKAEQAKPKPAPKPKVEQAKPQPVATKPAEQPQVETKTMAGMMVCKLLGDVCDRRPTGKPNYDAQNWCEFVDCVLFKNFQKLR